MKLNKLMAGLFVFGLGIASYGQVLAANTEMKVCAVSGVCAAQTQGTMSQQQEFYKNKCYEVMRNVLKVDPATLPKDTKISIKISTRAQLIKSSNEALEKMKKQYEAGTLTEDLYKEAIAIIEKDNKKTYGEVNCLFEVSVKNKRLKDFYMFQFNSNTQELISLQAPASNKGEAVFENGGKTTLSLDNLAEAYVKVVKDNKIGGIENPVCIKKFKGVVPELTYKDQNDASKQVKIGLDPVTGKIYHIFTDL